MLYLYICLYMLPPSHISTTALQFSIHPSHSPETDFGRITKSVAKVNGFFLILTILSAAFVTVDTFTRYLLSTCSVPDSCFTAVDKVGKMTVTAEDVCLHLL